MEKRALPKRIRNIFILSLVLFMIGCSQLRRLGWAPNRFSGITVTQEQMVRDCRYLATLSATSDPGQLFYPYRPWEGRQKVLEQATELGATHLVWLFDYRDGSAAAVYRCDQQDEAAAFYKPKQ